MPPTIQRFVGNRNPVGDAQGRSTTPNVSGSRRAEASFRRVGQRDLQAMKQEPSSQKSVVSSILKSEAVAQQDHRLKDEAQTQRDIFDSVSVAPEDFDVTKSTVDLHEGYGTRNGNGAYLGAPGFGHQNENHNAQFLPHDQHYRHQAAERNAEEDDDDNDESSLSDEMEDINAEDDEDDRTMNANEMLGMRQRGYDPETVLTALHGIQQHPNYPAFAAKTSSFPLRTNQPNHFANQTAPHTRSVYLPSQISTKAQQSVYKTQSSTLPSADQTHQREMNRQQNPTERYAPHRTSPIGQGNEWEGQSESLNGEDQVIKSSFAASIDSPDALLPPHPQGKRQYSGSEQSSEAPESSEPIDPDYDENVLYGLDYATLRDQPFDAKPGEHPPNKSTNLPPTDASLEDRLAMTSGESHERQGEYFSQMSKDEWEKSGDWFINQFTDLMKKMKEARQTKRDIAKKFEDEISVRQEAVRSKTEGIERVLSEMKTGGEGVLRRKM